MSDFATERFRDWCFENNITQQDFEQVVALGSEAQYGPWPAEEQIREREQELFEVTEEDKQFVREHDREAYS